MPLSKSRMRTSVALAGLLSFQACKRPTSRSGKEVRADYREWQRQAAQAFLLPEYPIESVDAYISAGGGEALNKALNIPREQIIAEVKKSGLRRLEREFYAPGHAGQRHGRAHDFQEAAARDGIHPGPTDRVSLNGVFLGHNVRSPLERASAPQQASYPAERIGARELVVAPIAKRCYKLAKANISRYDTDKTWGKRSHRGTTSP